MYNIYCIMYAAAHEPDGGGVAALPRPAPRRALARPPRANRII